MDAATAISGAASSASDPHRDYFTRLIPEPFRVLGLALRPLSVGRYRLMKRFDVAFVSDDPAKANVDDLILAVLICSMRVDEFLEFIQSPGYQREIRRWSRKIFPHSWISLVPFGIGKRWRAKHGFNTLQKIALFQRYIVQNSESPRYWDESDQLRVSSSHWSHTIEVVLRGQVGWTEEEINERPITKALYDFFKHMEMQGSVRLMTADEIEYLDTPATPKETEAMEEWARQLRAAGFGGNNPAAN